MAVKNLYTVNNEIICEHAIGSSRLDYLSEALGSVVATVAQALTVRKTFWYGFFGVDLNVSGTVPTLVWAEEQGQANSSSPTEVIDLTHLLIDGTILPNQSVTDSTRQYENGSPGLTAEEFGDYGGLQGRS